MSAFKNSVNEKLASTRKCGYKDVIRNEEGAIDLASIMVGVVVIGIVGSVIAATVFSVIPWAQDMAASQSLDAVKTAQSVAYASTAIDGPGVYLDKAELITGQPASDNTLLQAPLLQDAKNIAVVAVDDIDTTKAGNQAGFVAAALSGSGVIKYVSSDKVGVTEEAADDAALNTKFGTLLGGTFASADGALTFTATP